MKTRNYFIALALLNILANACNVLAYPQDLTVKKTALPEIITGDVLEVSISIKNDASEVMDAEVREYMVDAETVEAPQKPAETRQEIRKNNSGGALAWVDPYYKWEINLGPGEEKTLTYKIKPLVLGPFTIGPTEVVTGKGTYLSNSVHVTVRCNDNGICEGYLKENSINCQKDCPPGLKDEICNSDADGFCDPDCRENLDHDCIKPVCGDDRCEEGRSEDYRTCPQDCNKPLVCGDGACEKGESYGNCPVDCLSGGSDAYCDALKDASCDPDCPPKLDPDCKDACGNGICETPQGESRRTCPQDCPSGIKDAYCDSLKDGRCDPDCPRESDADCSGNDTLLYIVVTFAAAAIVLFIYARLRKK